jgi:hypothetical protein
LLAGGEIIAEARGDRLNVIADAAAPLRRWFN